MKISVAKSKQEALPEIGKKESNLYYLIITNKKEEKLVINVGEKTYTTVTELLKNDK